MFDKDLNLKWQKSERSNTPLALINDVNFKIINVKYTLDEKYAQNLKGKTNNEIELEVGRYNNIVRQTEIDWKVVKK